MAQIIEIPDNDPESNYPDRIHLKDRTVIRVWEFEEDHLVVEGVDIVLHIEDGARINSYGYWSLMRALAMAADIAIENHRQAGKQAWADEMWPWPLAEKP